MNRKFTLNFFNHPNKIAKHCTETTLYLVIIGELKGQYKNQAVSLVAGDLLLINPNQFIQLEPTTQQSCCYLELTLDNIFLASQIPNYYHTTFECYPAQIQKGRKEELAILRKFLAELALVELNQEPSKKIKRNLTLDQIVFTLVQYFQTETTSYQEHNDSKKLAEIIHYIDENFMESISLSSVAEYFFLSSATLSKFFKKETNRYFSEYLNEKRVIASLDELLYSKKSIETIAQDYGFSTSKTYRQQFKKKFNLTPSDYREKQEIESKKQPKQAQLEHDLPIKRSVLMTLYSFAQVSNQEGVSTEIAYQHRSIQIQRFTEQQTLTNGELIIHIGSLENIADQMVQEELLSIKKNMKIAYIGIQSIFETIPQSYTISQTTKMNAFPPFEKLDRILAFLKEHDLGVFYQLYLPDYQNLDALAKKARIQFLHHIHSQYGTHLLSKWKINCLFENTDPESYYQEFLEVYQICQQISTDLEIGAEVPLQDPYFEYSQRAKQTFFAEKIVPKCSFLSFIAEPNYVFFKPDSALPELDRYHHYVTEKTNFIKRTLRELNIDLPLYLTQWNTLTGMNTTINGTFFRGAIILKELLKLEDSVTGYAFWLNFDIYEHFRTNRPYKNDGLELFHYYSSKRPAFFCLSLAHRLKGTLLAKGSDFRLTRSNGGYQLLFWNTNYFDPHLSAEETFLNSQTVAFDIEIAGFPSADYQIKQIDFDRHNGALFYSYAEFQGSQSLDFEVQNYIKQITQPKIKVYDTTITDVFSYNSQLDTNGIRLLEIQPISYEK